MATTNGIVAAVIKTEPEPEAGGITTIDIATETTFENTNRKEEIDLPDIYEALE